MNVDLKDIKTNVEQPEIPLSVLRKIVKKFESQPDTFRLTFTYIMTACFPTVFENIMSYCKDCYTQGYIIGLKEGKDNES